MSLAWQIMIALVTGLLIGTVLGLVLWRWWLARQQKAASQKRQRGVLDSLDILCRALDQEQVESSEAVIRMSALLDCLPDSIEPKIDVAAIHQLAQACDQFSRGEARQTLTPRERMRQDKQRWWLEKEQKEGVKMATQRLFSALPAWRTGLGL